MNLLPVPKKIEETGGTYLVTYQQPISLTPLCGEKELGYAKILQQELDTRLGYTLPLLRAACADGKQGIVLNLTGTSEAESYRLEITKQGVRITADGTRGLWWGVSTLRQLVFQFGAVLPCVTIDDAPDFANRGFYHDITRGRVPTPAMLRELVDRMAYFKLNQLQLYIEHTYLYEDFSEMWRDDTPLTAQDILELDAYCRARGVELVPSFALFGHLHKLLCTRDYAPLCELEGSPENPVWLVDRMRHHTLDVSNPESIALVRRMLAEVLPLFSSEKVNICADETFDLGKGRSKAYVDKTGTHRAYVDFLKQICQAVADAGRTPMFWGDIILAQPELVKELPPGTICLNWGYGVEEGEEGAKRLRDAGAVQYCCPGTHTWMRFISRSDNAYQNIRNMCTFGKRYGAAGILTTDWGDLGHINPPRMSVPGLAYGAMFSWNDAPIPVEQADQMISSLVYGSRAQEVISLGLEISRKSRFDWCAAVHFMDIKNGMDWGCTAEEYLKETMDPTGIPALNAEIDGLIAKLYALLPGVEQDKRPMVYEYVLMAQGAKTFNSVGCHVCNRILGANEPAGQTPVEAAHALEYWWKDYRALWYAQSRPAEIALLQKIINDYGNLLRGA